MNYSVTIRLDIRCMLGFNGIFYESGIHIIRSEIICCMDIVHFTISSRSLFHRKYFYYIFSIRSFLKRLPCVHF